jgi:hypothetical protein
MQIRLKKGRDGPDSLACVREDGTSTWKRLQRGIAFHDLVHYALESELGIADGFFGLVEGGWTMDEFADAEERARIPPAAMWVEFVVNQLMTEGMSGEYTDEDVFHETLAKSTAKLGVAVPRKLDAEELARVRGKIVDVVGRWRSLPLGETLELPFSAAHAESKRRNG